MRLSKIVEAIGGVLHSGGTDPEVSAAQLDSRQVAPGHIFAALSDSQVERQRFVKDARRNGAAAVLTDCSLEVKHAPVQWIHPQPTVALGKACHLLADNPARDMTVIGITGTNGKTTTAHLVAHILRQNGMRPGVLGTAGHRLANEIWLPASHTTPAAPVLVDLAARHRDLGGDCLILELSSHALVQERHAGLIFDAAVFTNLTREHLDYHGDMGAYQAAKGRLFTALKPGARAIGNLDDHAWPSFSALARERGAEILTTSTRQRADLCAYALQATPQGITFCVQGMGISEQKICLPLFGRFNVENALAALGCALVAGVRLDHALASLASCTSAPGRMEVLGAGGDPLHGGVSSRARVVVDYAHTPDALGQALGALRASQPAGGRLVCVFGCGGERDEGKRPLMGRVASQQADHLIVTNDNPRSEDPNAIAKGICAGIDHSACSVEIDLDRERAIRAALAPEVLSDARNTVLVAGKGHETKQVDAEGAHDFDDRALIREILQEDMSCRA